MSPAPSQKPLFQNADSLFPLMKEPRSKNGAKHLSHMPEIVDGAFAFTVCWCVQYVNIKLHICPREEV